jgi:hypothetical protein
LTARLEQVIDLCHESRRVHGTKLPDGTVHITRCADISVLTYGHLNINSIQSDLFQYNQLRHFIEVQSRCREID